MLTRLPREQRCAEDCLQRQLPGRRDRKSLTDPCFAEGLDELVHVGGPGTREASHRVHARLGKAEHATDRAQNALGALEILLAGAGVVCERADPRRDQRGRVGHGPKHSGSVRKYGP